MRRVGLHIPAIALVQFALEALFVERGGPRVWYSLCRLRRFLLHYLIEGVEFAYFVPALVRHLDVLTAHQHHITDVEKVNPIKSIGPPRTKLSRQLGRLRYAELVSLRLSIHVVIAFEALDFLDGLEAQLQVFDHVR